MKADNIDIINNYLIVNAQIKSDHVTASPESQAMKDLLKKAMTKNISLWTTGDYEQINDRSDLSDYMDHVNVDTN